MTMEEGIISKWLVEDGDPVTKGQVIVEFETDKINAEIEAPVDGVIGGIAARAGESVKVQGVVAYVLEEGEEPPAAEAADGPVSAVPASPPAVEPAPPPVAVPPAQPVRAVSQPPPVAVQAARPADGRIKASPLAKRLATEFGVDIAVLQGSGPRRPDRCQRRSRRRGRAESRGPGSRCRACCGCRRSARGNEKSDRGPDDAEPLDHGAANARHRG